MTEFLPIVKQVNWEIAPLMHNLPDSFELQLSQNDATLLLGSLCDEFSSKMGPLFRATVPVENLKQYENGTYMSITQGQNGGFGAHAGFQPLTQDGISYVINNLMGRCYNAILSEMRMKYAQHLMELRIEQMKREENILNIAMTQYQFILLNEKENEQNLEMRNIKNNISELFKELASHIFENPLMRFVYLQKILDWKDTISKISLDLIDNLNIQCDNIEQQNQQIYKFVDFCKIHKLYSLCRIAIEMYLQLNLLEFLFSGNFYVEECVNERKKNIEEGYLTNFAKVDTRIKNALSNLQTHIKTCMNPPGVINPYISLQEQDIPVPPGWEFFYQSLEDLKKEKQLPITTDSLVNISKEILKIPQNMTLRIDKS